MNFELLRVGLAVVATSLAAYQDAKTSFIDDRLTIGMVVAGTLLNIAAWDWDFGLYSIGVTLLIFAVGYLLYVTGQLGGGDVLLFCGLQSLLPLFPQAAMLGFYSAIGILVPPAAVAFPLSSVPFILSIYLTSSFAGIAGSGLIYGAKLFRRTKFRKLNPDYPLGLVMLVLSSILLYWMAFVFHLSASKIAVALLVLVPSTFMVAFKRDISQKVALSWMEIPKMEDEDIIDTDRMPPQIVERYGVGRVLTKEMKAVLQKIERKEGIHKFPIQKDLPRFGPYILAGLLLALLLADPLSVFLFF